MPTKKAVKVTIDTALIKHLDAFVASTVYTKSDVVNMLLRDFFYNKDTAKILRDLLIDD